MNIRTEKWIAAEWAAENLRRFENFALCLTATLNQSEAILQAEGVTDYKKREIIQQIRQNPNYAWRVDSYHFAAIANLALAAYHPDHPFRWVGICDWGNTEYAQQVAGINKK